MTKCPKCGGKDIGGPIYVDTWMHGEYLAYYCKRCGYQSKSPPLDDKGISIEEQGD